MKKRIFSFMLSVCMVLTLLPAMGAAAADATASGKCGDAVTWSLSGGTITFSGSGGMTAKEGQTYDYGQYKNSITAVVINEGVTTVGDFAFYKFPNLTSVTAASTVKTVGLSAFA